MKNGLLKFLSCRRSCCYCRSCRRQCHQGEQLLQSTLHALHTLLPHIECIAFVCKYKHSHAHMQTNTFTQSKQKEKKLKHQYQLKNMNKEQEPVLGIEKSRLLCNFVGETGAIWDGVCLPHSVFTWKYGVLVVCRRDTMHKLLMLMMLLLLLCCTHKFSVIFDFRSIYCLLRQQNHCDRWSLQLCVCVCERADIYVAVFWSIYLQRCHSTTTIIIIIIGILSWS